MPEQKLFKSDLAEINWGDVSKRYATACRKQNKKRKKFLTSTSSSLVHEIDLWNAHQCREAWKFFAYGMKPAMSPVVTRIERKVPANEIETPKGERARITRMPTRGETMTQEDGAKIESQLEDNVDKNGRAQSIREDKQCHDNGSVAIDVPKRDGQSLQTGDNGNESKVSEKIAFESDSLPSYPMSDDDDIFEGATLSMTSMEKKKFRSKAISKQSHPLLHLLLSVQPVGKNTMYDQTMRINSVANASRKKKGVS